MWQLSETVDGMTEALDAFGVPCVGGNVSLYNESRGADIDPTPVIGVLGMVDRLDRRPPGVDAGRRRSPGAGRPDRSRAVRVALGRDHGHRGRGELPPFDLATVALTADKVRELVGGRTGARRPRRRFRAVSVSRWRRWSSGPASGSPRPASRITPTCSPSPPAEPCCASIAEQSRVVLDVLDGAGVPYRRIGVAGGDRFTVKGLLDVARRRAPFELAEPSARRPRGRHHPGVTVGRVRTEPVGPAARRQPSDGADRLVPRPAGRRSFLVRVEDLTTGAEPIGEAEQLADLAALGLVHDGPVVRQSERTASYDAAIDRLVDHRYDVSVLLHPTARSDGDRAASEAPHGPSPDGAYPGTCRDLTDAERSGRLDDVGRPAAVRLRAGGDDGRVRRPVRRPGRTRRRRFRASTGRDGLAAYNLAVVVDDAASRRRPGRARRRPGGHTPRQMLLQRCSASRHRSTSTSRSCWAPTGNGSRSATVRFPSPTCARRGVVRATCSRRLARSIGIQSPGHGDRGRSRPRRPWSSGSISAGSREARWTFDTLVADSRPDRRRTGDDPGPR